VVEVVASVDERGVSLVEVLAALAIVAIVVTAFLAALYTGARSAGVVRERVTAENIARSQLEQVKETDFIAGTDHYTPSAISHPGYTAVISAATIITDMQWITVTILYNGERTFTMEEYKVNR